MNSTNNYNYIIAGAGASGLSLAWHLVQSPLKKYRILIIDADMRPGNSKTWCFWHKEEPPFKSIIHKRWNTAEVLINNEEVSEELDKYTYYCIKSGDYKEYILNELQNHDSIDIVEAPIEQIIGNEKTPYLKTPKNRYSADYIFQSCFIPPQFKSPKIQYPLTQSFLGYDIETQQSLFKSNAFLLMDFDDSYEGGLAFMYVLPWSKSNALLEYTIFDKQIRSEEFYQKKIELYLANKYGLKRIDYRIARKEYGEIPMQDLPYAPWYQPRVMNLGSSGGLTKPSTGYTFKRIQEHSKAIVEQLQQDGTPALPYRSSFRYRAYDLWLLQIMHDNPGKALQVFHDLFTGNKMDNIFKFLDEQSTLKEDLKIMSSVPYIPFFKAMWECRKRLFEI